MKCEGDKETRKCKSFKERTLERVTYAMPAGVVSVCSLNTILCKVLPCTFEMVVAYPARRGYFVTGISSMRLVMGNKLMVCPLG